MWKCLNVVKQYLLCKTISLFSLCKSILSSAVHDNSIADLGEAVWVVNFTLSGEIQDVDTGLTALGDTMAELEGRMENLEGELTSIEELISELESRLTKLEVAGILVLKDNHHGTRSPYQCQNLVVYFYYIPVCRQVITSVRSV